MLLDQINLNVLSIHILYNIYFYSDRVLALRSIHIDVMELCLLIGQLCCAYVCLLVFVSWHFLDNICIVHLDAHCGIHHAVH